MSERLAAQPFCSINHHLLLAILMLSHVLTCTRVSIGVYQAGGQGRKPTRPRSRPPVLPAWARPWRQRGGGGGNHHTDLAGGALGLGLLGRMLGSFQSLSLCNVCACL